MEFPLQQGFHAFAVVRVETKTDAAIGTEMARHVDQFAADAGAFDDFFRAQRMAHGFKKNYGVVVSCRHERGFPFRLTSFRSASQASSTSCCVLKNPKLKRTVPVGKVPIVRWADGAQ